MRAPSFVLYDIVTRYMMDSDYHGGTFLLASGRRTDVWRTSEIQKRPPNPEMSDANAKEKRQQAHNFHLATIFTTCQRCSTPLNMMSTTLTRIGRSAKTPIATAVDRALAQQATSAFSTATLNHFSALQSPTTSTSANTYPIQIRTLSIQTLDTAACEQDQGRAQGGGCQLGRQVRKKCCLMHSRPLSDTEDSRDPFSVFFRIDADELKLLLKKHNSSFTDEEIVELGELYYAGKSGGAVVRSIVSLKRSTLPPPLPLTAMTRK
jgi:hypothetical protein